MIPTVSVEGIDPSFQVQTLEEEIELLHTQFEHLQPINFPEFVTNNSQIIAPPINSLGATCTKHLLQTFADFKPECQTGNYCPECVELCPLSVNTVIHHCQNCAEPYCLLCVHELGCVL